MQCVREGVSEELHHCDTGELVVVEVQQLRAVVEVKGVRVQAAVARH